MSLIFLDDSRPRCFGNCNQGRKPCTMPGVCTARRKPEPPAPTKRQHPVLVLLQRVMR